MFAEDLPMPYHAVALLAALVLNATANLLLKFAARDLGPTQDLLADGWGHAIKAMAGCPRLILGILFFALNVPLYFLALQKLKVSLAYPIMIGGAFAIIVTVASFSGLNEQLSAFQWLGVGIVLIGVILVASTMPR